MALGLIFLMSLFQLQAFLYAIPHPVPAANPAPAVPAASPSPSACVDEPEFLAAESTVTGQALMKEMELFVRTAQNGRPRGDSAKAAEERGSYDPSSNRDHDHFHAGVREQDPPS